MKVLSVIVFDVDTKVFDTEIFPQHAISDLKSDITFTAFFSQEKNLWWKEINTHTHILTCTMSLVKKYNEVKQKKIKVFECKK